MKLELDNDIKNNIKKYSKHSEYHPDALIELFVVLIIKKILQSRKIALLVKHSSFLVVNGLKTIFGILINSGMNNI